MDTGSKQKQRELASILPHKAGILLAEDEDSHRSQTRGRSHVAGMNAQPFPGRDRDRARDEVRTLPGTTRDMKRDAERDRRRDGGRPSA